MSFLQQLSYRKSETGAKSPIARDSRCSEPVREPFARASNRYAFVPFLKCAHGKRSASWHAPILKRLILAQFSNSPWTGGAIRIFSTLQISVTGGVSARGGNC